jgi:hypothetical protein
MEEKAEEAPSRSLRRDEFNTGFQLLEFIGLK